MNFKNQLSRGFSGGAVVKNPPASAGDTGSSPGPGRSYMPRSNAAHMSQLLSLHSRAREPQLLSPRATTTEGRTPRARAPQQEKPAHRNEEQPPLITTRESLRVATKTQHSQK